MRSLKVTSVCKGAARRLVLASRLLRSNGQDGAGAERSSAFRRALELPAWGRGRQGKLQSAAQRWTEPRLQRTAELRSAPAASLADKGGSILLDIV